jgi:hypothetical protein
MKNKQKRFNLFDIRIIALIGVILPGCGNRSDMAVNRSSVYAFEDYIKNAVTLSMKPLSVGDDDLIEFNSEGWWGFAQARTSLENQSYSGRAFQVFPSFKLHISSALVDSTEQVFIKQYSLKVVGTQKIATKDFRFFALTPGAPSPHTFIHAYVERSIGNVWPINFGASFSEELDYEVVENIRKHIEDCTVLDPGVEISFFVSQFYEPAFEIGSDHQWFYDSGMEQVLLVKAQADIVIDSVELTLESNEVLLLIDFRSENSDYETTSDPGSFIDLSVRSVLSKEEYSRLARKIEYPRP